MKMYAVRNACYEIAVTSVRTTEAEVMQSLVDKFGSLENAGGFDIVEFDTGSSEAEDYFGSIMGGNKPLNIVIADGVTERKVWPK